MAPSKGQKRGWVAAGLVAILLVFVLDRFTSASIALVTLTAVGPLLAAVGGSRAAALAVAALALALSIVMLSLDEPWSGQDYVRLVTVFVVCGLAVVLAALRGDLEQSTAVARDTGLRAEETLALLDVIFARAPVGLGFHDLDGRFVRINDRLAEINGFPPEEHIGRTLAEILPAMPEPGEEVARVARTGRPSTEVETRGETPARPGVEREWIASYWPVRSSSGGGVLGVGTVVFEVTERRAAERALRTQTDRYETLLTALAEVGEGMIVIEDDRCVYANTAFEQLSGYTFPELAAMESVYSIVAPEARDEAERRARLRVERDIVDTTYEVAIQRRDGTRVLLELAGVPLEIGGSPPRHQLVIVVRDVTARRRAEEEREKLLRRSALLAEASALFDQSLDEERTLDSVARLCVRDLADTCLVVLGESGTGTRRGAVVARDPEREAGLGRGHPVAGVADVLRTGEAAIFDDPADAPPGVQTLVVVPLSARGRVVGAMAAGFDALPAAERDDTLALLEDLGRRAALALDNARLYEERTAVAQTLQRSLLPPELPLIPGAQLAARYLASGDGLEIGGDFYDCFGTGDGWALIIGDVCGKGAEAAAITALARYTLRASVMHGSTPAAALVELNDALLREGLDYRFCTVLYASVMPRAEGCEVVLVTGGHPLPLVLRAEGTVEAAGSPGTLLGIVDDPEISEERAMLEPGDTLVLYTDGVVEASPADDALGEGPLTELLASCAGAEAGAIAEAIEAKALEVQDGRLRDDVAVVVLRVSAGLRASFGADGAGVAQAT